MVQINFAQKQVNAKIVYYGPGMSGKTTNLEIVHQRAPSANRGDLTSISTDGDRTLFFDFMPLDLGTVAGMRTCFQIYTVPGQVYYNSTRKLVLQGVDGVVFVADSSGSMVQENLESLKNLEQNLNEYGKSLASLPHVIQFNKRDLPDAMTVEELTRLLNAHGAPCYEAVANTGQGVFPTLKALAARVLETIHTGSRPGTAPPTAAPLPFTPPMPVPAPVHAAAATGYNARPLHQTGYTPVAPGTSHGPAPIPMPARPSVPAAAQSHPPQTQVPMPARPSVPAPAQGHGPQTQIPMPRAPVHPGADTVSRTAIHAPPAPRGPAPIPMQSIPTAPAPAQNIVRGYPAQASAPGAMPTPSGLGNLQMMRAENPMAMPPAAGVRPQAAVPARPARPTARPPAPRPIQPRPAAPRIDTGRRGKKRSFTTVMLVVAALVAGAVMAVAVLT